MSVNGASLGLLGTGLPFTFTALFRTAKPVRYAYQEWYRFG